MSKSLHLRTIVCAAVLCAAPLGTPCVATAAPAQPAASQQDSPTVYVPDDDSVAAELTYHWQNPRYSRDERRQIGYIAVFLAAVGATAAVRPLLRSRRRQTAAASREGVR